MSYESLKDILSNAKGQGWSADNVSFGSGGEREGVQVMSPLGVEVILQRDLFKDLGLGTSVLSLQVIHVYWSLC